MEITLLYLFVGVCIGVFFYMIADSRPFFPFLVLCNCLVPPSSNWNALHSVFH